MSRVVAGLVAAVPLVVAAALYVFAGNAAAAFREDPDLAQMTTGQLRLVLAAAFAAGALFLGVAGAVVYGWPGVPATFRLLAVGLAVAMSIAALISRTPLMGPKIVMNFAVAAVLGYLIPLLTRS